jgi:precorrin-6B methylase 1
MRVKSKGTVYLVGAGPGDAGLLTLRGAELLRRADVVLYDALVNPALLRLAPPSAELIARGKNMTMPQEEITALLIARAREGKCVVRLKGGDPYIFGRGGEEAEALAAAKIPFEVVPGVSSVVAAPNYAGIPLTHRGHCSSFTVFTGHAIRPMMPKRLCATSKSPKSPAPRSCSWARKIWRLDEIAHRARDVAGDARGRGPMGHDGPATKSVTGTLATIAGWPLKKNCRRRC